MVKKENKRITITLTEKGQRALKEIKEALDEINKTFDYGAKTPTDTKIINQALVSYLGIIRNSYVKYDAEETPKQDK